MRDAPLLTDHGAGLGRAAAIAIAALAVGRACVSVVPQVRFDVDPAINPAGYAGIGPSGSMAIDAALLVACVLAFAAEHAAGRRILGWMVGAAALPSLAIVYHGASDTIDLFRGSTWLAGAMAAVAAAHLGRDPGHRRILIAGALAVVAPYIVRGAEQVLIEHPATVRFFAENRDAILAERGWAPGSPAAEMFERRLRQSEATAWLGLANLYSAVMAFGVIGFGGLAILVRARRLLAVGCALLALVAMALLLHNGSKGALGATAIGVALAALGSVGPLAMPKRQVAVASLALAAITLVALAPFLRGLVPEDAGGERSLLFRWHYLDGAMRAIPEAIPLGLGPDGFQDTYLRTKPPRSPEDVTSAHAMAVDWLILLGPLGLAWVALVVRLLLVAPSDLREERSAGSSGALRAAAIIALFTLAAQSFAEESIADLGWVMGRGLACIAFIVAFVVAERALAALPPNRSRGVLLGAIVAVVAQAQIEMIFFLPGLPVWAFVALGAIAGPVAVGLTRRERGFLDAVPVALPGAIAVVVLVLGAIPQWRQDRLLDAAAARVAPLADVRDQWQEGMTRELASGESGPASQRIANVVREAGGIELDAAFRSALAVGESREARAAAVVRALQRFDAGQRAKAADLLREADQIHPANDVAIVAAIKQLAASGRRTVGARRAEIVDPVLHTAAIDLAAEYFDSRGSARAAAMLADLWLERARATSDEATLATALAVVDAAIERQPRSALRRVDRADLLAARGDALGAATSYRDALSIDADLELDPLVQFAPPQRRAIESRLATVAAAARGEADLPRGWPLTTID